MECIGEQSKTPGPHGAYKVRMKKMMILKMKMKMASNAVSLESLGGNKMTSHVAMALPWKACNPINFPSYTVRPLRVQRRLYSFLYLYFLVF